MMKKKAIATTLVAVLLAGMTAGLAGCGSDSETADGKTRISILQYKPEAVKAFEKMQEEFNATHDDIYLTIESPNDAMTVFKNTFDQRRCPRHHRDRRRRELFQLPRCGNPQGHL